MKAAIFVDMKTQNEQTEKAIAVSSFDNFLISGSTYGETTECRAIIFRSQRGRLEC